MKLMEDMIKIDYKLIEDFEKRAMEAAVKAIPDLKVDDTILSTVSQPMVLAINLMFPMDKIIVKGDINVLIKEALNDEAIASLVHNIQRHSIKKITNFYFMRSDLPPMFTFGGNLLSYSNVSNSNIIVPTAQRVDNKRIIRSR